MSAGLSVRRRPSDPGVPIEYAVLSHASEAGDGAEAARDAGFQAGFAEGLEAARTQAAEAARRDRASVQQALGALADASGAAAATFAERRGELEHSVTAFAFELVETLVGRELALATEPGRDAVARALAADDTGLPATVRLHPDDTEALRGVDEDALAGSRELTIVADASVTPGGALVLIGGSTIDSQLSTALQRVRDVLLGPDGEDRGDGPDGDAS